MGHDEYARLSVSTTATAVATCNALCAAVLHADNEVVAAAEALREKQGVLAQSFLSLGRTLVALKFSKSPRDYEDILVGVRDSQKAAVKTLLGGDASAERVSQMFQFLWDKTNGVIQRKSAVTLAC